MKYKILFMMMTVLAMASNILADTSGIIVGRDNNIISGIIVGICSAISGIIVG